MANYRFTYRSETLDPFTDGAYTVTVTYVSTPGVADYKVVTFGDSASKADAISYMSDSIEAYWVTQGVSSLFSIVSVSIEEATQFVAVEVVYDIDETVFTGNNIATMAPQKLGSIISDFGIWDSDQITVIGSPTITSNTVTVPQQFSLTGLFQVSQSGSLIVQDATGEYSAANTSGWGTPNPEIADMTNAALSVTLPDATTLLPNGTPITWDSSSDPAFYNLFPNTGIPKFVVTGEMAGYGADSKLADGIYQVDYQATNGTITYSYSRYVMVDRTVECCLNKLADSGCGCGESKRYSRGTTALGAARAAIECQNITVAAKNLLYAIDICGGCKGC